MYREEKIRDLLATTLPPMMVITFALMSGIAAYGGFILVTLGPPDWGQIGKLAGPITITACAMGLSNLVLANVIPQVISAHRRKELDAKSSLESNVQELGGVYRLNTIIAAALLEGAGFVGVVAYQMEGSVIGLGVAAAMVLGIAAMFPLPSRVCLWVERQLQMIEDNNHLHDSF